MEHAEEELGCPAWVTAGRTSLGGEAGVRCWEASQFAQRELAQSAQDRVSQPASAAHISSPFQL